jgi:hypothetical protein
MRGKINMIRPLDRLVVVALGVMLAATGCACETLTEPEWRTLEADAREHADDLELALIIEPENYLPDSALTPDENERRASRLRIIAAAARAWAEAIRQANPYTRDPDAPPNE